MTVINAMKFSATQGGMVADSQSSTDLRKYDLAEKVVNVSASNGTTVLMGGAGATDFLYEARTTLKETLAERKEKYDVRTVAFQLSKIMIGMKRDTIASYLQSQFGVSYQQALSGEGIAPQFLAPIGEALSGQDRNGKMLFNGAFVVVGKDDKGTEIYSVMIGGRPFPSSSPYLSVGSGSDESDKVLYGFVRELKRDQRTNIDWVDGMASLIRATAASSDINQGVGGVPTISYFDNGGVTVLGEDESRLATEVVKVHDAGMLTGPVTRRSLECLLTGAESLETVEKLMLGKDPQAVNGLLRGYKS